MDINPREFQLTNSGTYSQYMYFVHQYRNKKLNHLLK